jgi:hypothetical protein
MAGTSPSLQGQLWFWLFTYLDLLEISFMGWTLKWTLNVVPDIHHFYFFLIFSNFFGYFFIRTKKFPYSDVALDPTQTTPASSSTMKHFYLFLIFSSFSGCILVGYYIGKSTLDPENVT